MLDSRDLERFDAHEDKRMKRIEETLKGVERALVAVTKSMEEISESLKKTVALEHGAVPRGELFEWDEDPIRPVDSEAPGESIHWDSHSRFLAGLEEFDD